MTVRSLLRDPLVHFLLIGAALFAIGWGTTGGGEPRGTRAACFRDCADEKLFIRGPGMAFEAVRPR